MTRARDVMQPKPETVKPGTTLVDLDRKLLASRHGGFPVIEDGRLVGIVSRSDVVRKLGVEQARSEMACDFYTEVGGFDRKMVPLAELAPFVGARLEGATVADVMSADVVSVSPDLPIAEVAALLVERGLHRVPVVDGDELVGILTSLDVARLVAEGTLR